MWQIRSLTRQHTTLLCSARICDNPVLAVHCKRGTKILCLPVWDLVKLLGRRLSDLGQGPSQAQGWAPALDSLMAPCLGSKQGPLQVLVP